jgi:hypothetical protein
MSRARFERLASDVLATMPEPVGPALALAAVRHRDVPPASPQAGEVPLVRLEVRGGRVVSLTIYRRPLEARAISALDLADLLRLSIAKEAADLLGLDLGDEWDDLD